MTALRRLALPAAALTLTACGAGPDASSPTAPLAVRAEGVTQTFTSRDGDVFFNPCTGEWVGFDPGSVQHEVVRVADDGHGGFHVTFHVNGQHYHGPGLDAGGSPTGTRYQGAFAENYTFHARPPFPATETWTRAVRVVSSGSLPNFVVKLRFLLTVDARGEVRVDRGGVEVVCAG